MSAAYLLEYTDSLEKTGIPPKIARIHAKALISASEEQRDFINKELATKSDIKDLKSEIKDLKSEIKVQFEKIDSKFETMDSKFEKIDSKFETMDSKIEASKYFTIITIVGLSPVMIIFTKYLMKFFNL